MASISSSRIAPGRRGTLAALVSGVGLGIATGLAGLGAFAALALGGDAAAPSLDPHRLIDAAHVPPLLTAPGEHVRLRYDIYCAAPGDDPESGAPCDAAGEVHVRAGSAGPWQTLPLRLDARADEGRWYADMPADVASSPDGFSYWAEVRDRAGGAAMTLPAGGADAPVRSLPLGDATTVDLGTHAFGVAAAPVATVFSAGWGSGATQVGLEGGRGLQAIGPSAFDVSADGAVTLLDQVNRRAIRLHGGRRTLVPLAIDGTEADLAVGGGGELHVLEPARRGRGPELASFGPDGSERARVALGERTASQVRIGPAGPLVKSYPSEQWFPAAASPWSQARGGDAARTIADGRRVVVLREGDEIRLALADGNGARRAWRLRSGSRVAEVQLAEPLGRSRLAVVFRVYTDTADEFEAVVLGPRGVERRLSLASLDWAETAPLSRFRLHGTSLYRLGSTPAGVRIDRFDLGAAS